MLKKKDDNDTDWASTSEKSEQTSAIEEANENPCNVLTAQSKKEKHFDAWLLDSGCTDHMCPKGNGSVQTSLSREA